VKFDPSQIEQVHGLIRSHFKSQLEDRNSFLKTTGDEFSESGLQGLFEDGSAANYMNKIGLDRKSATEDKDTARMYYCLRAEYETNLIADMAEFVMGAGVTKAIMPTRFLALIGRLGPRASSFVTTGLSSLGGASTTTLYRACVRDNHGRTETNQGVKLSDATSKLPNGFEFNFLKLNSLPMSSVPACEAKQIDRLVMSNSEVSSCLYEAVFNILPPSIAIPLSVL
jgi:hypothetical protein